MNRCILCVCVKSINEFDRRVSSLSLSKKKILECVEFLTSGDSKTEYILELVIKNPLNYLINLC